MLNRSFHLIWIKLRIQNKIHFNLPFPIPLYIFQELLDCILDLLIFTCLFIPKPAKPQPYSSFSYTVYTVKELVQMIIKLFDSLTESAPYDFVDVAAENVRVSIKIS